MQYNLIRLSGMTAEAAAAAAGFTDCVGIIQSARADGDGRACAE
jgi:hypothetical protein